jgi:hypothetical protein
VTFHGTHETRERKNRADIVDLAARAGLDSEGVQSRRGRHGSWSECGPISAGGDEAGLAVRVRGVCHEVDARQLQQRARRRHAGENVERVKAGPSWVLAGV